MVDSAFHTSEIGEIGAVFLMLRKCVRDPPRDLLRQEFECTQLMVVCVIMRMVLYEKLCVSVKFQP